MFLSTHSKDVKWKSCEAHIKKEVWTMCRRHFKQWEWFLHAIKCARSRSFDSAFGVRVVLSIWPKPLGQSVQWPGAPSSALLSSVLVWNSGKMREFSPQRDNMCTYTDWRWFWIGPWMNVLWNFVVKSRMQAMEGQALSVCMVDRRFGCCLLINERTCILVLNQFGWTNIFVEYLKWHWSCVLICKFSE